MAEKEKKFCGHCAHKGSLPCCAKDGRHARDEMDKCALYKPSSEHRIALALEKIVDGLV